MVQTPFHRKNHILLPNLLLIHTGNRATVQDSAMGLEEGSGPGKEDSVFFSQQV